MTVADATISLNGSVAVLAVGVLLLAGATYLFYRFTLPPLPSRRRFTLSALRALGLVLLLMILFEPIIRLVRRQDQRPVVAVLIDDSQSMTIRDGAGDRAQILRAILSKSIGKHLPPSAEVKYYTFSSKVRPQQQLVIDSLSFNGEVTDLSEAFGAMKERLQKENIRAAILLSDGDYTAGKNPLYDAEALAIPVYTIGVGDTADQKDLLIGRLLSNNLAYTETQVPVDVTVRSTGFGGENVELTISDAAGVQDRKKFTLQSGMHEYPISLHVIPKEEGTKKYTVSVSKLPGELTERNNARSFFMKVLKSRLRVLLIAGAPGPDVAAVRQILTEDNQLNVRTLVQKNASQFYEGTLTKSLIDSADCLVSVGFPSAFTSDAAVQQLRDAISEAKKPLLFINGKTIDYQKLQLLEPFLPFSWSAAGDAEVLAGSSVPEKAKHHTLISMEGKVSAETWQQLPPLYKSQTAFRAKPEAEVLAFAVLQNIVFPEPLVALRNIARQKSFAITGYSIWRWRLMAQTNPQTAHFLPLLLTNTVRWLTTNEDNKRVRILPVKEMFTSAEPIEFTGQVYDEQLRPVDNAEVSVQMERGSPPTARRMPAAGMEKVQFNLVSIGSGMYEGSIEGVGEGDYAFVGKASTDGRPLGDDRGTFSVGEVNVEFLDTKMNKQLLEQIAYRTGGRYYDLKDAGSVDGDLSASVKLEPKELVEASEVELWNWKYLAGIVIFLFALEWFMRKRSGML